MRKTSKVLIACAIIAVTAITSGFLYWTSINRNFSAQVDLSEAQVETILEHLRSPTPPPYPDLHRNFEEKYNSGYRHPQVSEALRQLDQVGPQHYPRLMRELKSDDYSYSEVTSTWINRTVSSVIEDFFEKKYKNIDLKNNGKFISSNNNTRFISMLNEKGDLWVRENITDKSEREISLLYSQWVAEIIKK
jgi:hypothetical protein